MASHKLLTITARGRLLMKYEGVMPSTMSAASMPPTNAAIVVHSVISGMASAMAIARGITRRKPCGMPRP